MGASRIAATADSRAASTHANVDTRRTGMPRSRARWAFSADARSAMPYGDHFKKAKSAAATIGPTTRTSTSPVWRMTRPNSIGGRSNGKGKVAAPPNATSVPPCVLGLGIPVRAAVMICETPIVAMSTIRRGLENSRRITVSSIKAPRAAVAARVQASEAR